MTGRTTRWLRAWMRDERAAASVEFALAVPLFIILIFSTINGSIMYSAQSQMHYAAQRTARCISVGDPACADADGYAKGIYTGPDLTGLAFTSAEDPVCGNQVSANGTYELVSGFASTSVTISAQSCYPTI